MHCMRVTEEVIFRAKFKVLFEFCMCWSAKWEEKKYERHMNPFPLADDRDKKLSPCDVPNEPWRATDWDSADPLPLFCPDAYIPPDVPPAPPPEDFPLGCHVHLRGEERLQIVQGDQYCGGLQQLLAATNGLLRVVRHSGDYTFVLAEDNSDFIVGCSVHRAALTGPTSSMKPKKGESFSFEGLSKSARTSNPSQSSRRVSRSDSHIDRYALGHST